MSSHEKAHLNSKLAISYSNSIIGTGYLAYRDLGSLINQYVTGRKALDYGCGRGRSSHFLSKHNFEVEAIDICSDMIEQASKQYSSVNFRVVNGFQSECTDNSFDLILSQLLLVEINSQTKIMAMLSEQYRVLKPGGILIHTTASEALLHHKWLSIKVDYPQNNQVKNGEAGRIKLVNRNLELKSYYWSENVLRENFKAAGFELLTLHQPLGHQEDPYHWKSELKISPYLIFVLKKP